MKNTIAALCLIVTSLFSFAATAADYQTTEEQTTNQTLRSEDITTLPFQIMRRCVDDGGCRPGVETCIGGTCQPNRERPPSCHADRECTPLQCIGGRCQ